MNKILVVVPLVVALFTTGADGAGCTVEDKASQGTKKATSKKWQTMKGGKTYTVDFWNEGTWKSPGTKCKWSTNNLWSNKYKYYGPNKNGHNVAILGFNIAEFTSNRYCSWTRVN